MFEINTVEEFKEKIVEGFVLAYFYTTWCGPCKMIKQDIKELSKEIDDIKFLQVNADQFTDITKLCEVSTIPTLLFMKDGQNLEKKVGFTSKQEIQEFIADSKLANQMKAEEEVLEKDA
ncbi:thioredoxin [Bacillus toyonensis]|uniref:thioredoxin family protein n=1 Tax=Bacillus toyonensis TaxID=155322 RepID=UPI000BF431FF|nr:thioredoxin family protein [Bacillus toyonensis]PGC48740.1 thioredoxin [Bacillus toyonensis]